MGLQAPRGPLRALIAEDEAAVRELLAESIRGEPEFEPASRPVEAPAEQRADRGL